MTDKIRAELDGCYEEAVRQGYQGSRDEWQPTPHDLDWVCEAIGRTPTREEWREAGAGYVLGPVAEVDERIGDGVDYNRNDGLRWYIRATHPTGVPMDPMLCRWYETYEQALDELRWQDAQERQG